MGGYSKENIPRLSTGYLAMAVSGYLIVTGDNLPVFLGSVFFLIICATDTHFSRIPNVASLTMVLSGFGYHVSTSGIYGISTPFFGMMLGLCLLIVPYLLGGMGAGDVKALAALGALLGPGAIFQVFLYTGLVGGLMAILHYAFNHDLKKKFARGFNALRVFAYSREARDLMPEPNEEKLRFPYAAAIAFGFFAYTHWGTLI